MLLSLIALSLVPPVHHAHPLRPPVHTVASAMSNAQILGWTAQADAGEIEEAKLASTKATTPAVRTFAQTLAADHQKSLDAGSALGKKLNITPAMNPDTSMAKDHAKDMVNLQSKTGTDFDKAFLDGEIDGHQKVINTFNKKLIPDATNAQLKAHLRATLPTLQKHLNMAKSLRKRIK